MFKKLALLLDTLNIIIMNIKQCFEMNKSLFRGYVVYDCNTHAILMLPLYHSSLLCGNSSFLEACVVTEMSLFLYFS